VGRYPCHERAKQSAELATTACTTATGTASGGDGIFDEENGPVRDPPIHRCGAQFVLQFEVQIHEIAERAGHIRAGFI
jgi:hypothetical protein